MYSNASASSASPETTPYPGATTSGFAVYPFGSDIVLSTGPTLLNAITPESSTDAPTVIDSSTIPGEFIENA
ncbi:hypothetical protein ES708_28907 [subsurface metagenome]